MYESDDKMVSHPQHYQSASGLEVIDVIEAFTEGLTGIEATDTGNILKYACRWKQKNGVQDLKKIMWYTQHLIDHLEKSDRVEHNSDRYEITFTTSEGAKNVWSEMDKILKLYGLVRLADLKDLSGLPSSFCDTTEGWINLDDVPIIDTGTEYVLSMPKPLPFDILNKKGEEQS